MSNYLKINALKVENIRCYEKQEFSFIHGNNTLLGENGSGKSTILLSIGVGLFGSSYLKSMNISDLINRSHKSGKITLDFETVQGKYRSIFNIREKKNEFKLYMHKDTGRLEELTTRAKETRERINSLIGRDLDAEMFRNALSSPQGELTELIDLTPKKRKDAIRKILGLEKYQILEKHMSNILKGIEKERSLNVRELSARSETTEDPSEIENEIDTKTGELKAKEEELEKVNLKLLALEKSLDGERKRRDQYTDLKSKIGIVSKNLQDVKSKRENLLPLVSESCETLGIDMNLDDVKKYRIDIQNKWDSVLNEINGITTKLEDLQDNTTKKKKRVEVLEQQENDLNKAEKAISELLEGKALKEMQKESEEKSNQLHDLEKTIALKKSKLENTELKIESDTKTLNELNTKLKTSAAKFHKMFKKEITSLPEVYKQLSERIEEFKNERESIEFELQKLRKQKTEFETEMSSITKTIDLLENSAETENCPTCRQKLVGINLSEVLSIHKNTNKDLKKKIKELGTTVDKYKKKEIELKRKIEKLEKELREINKFDLDEYNVMTAKREELKELIAKSTETKLQLDEEEKNLAVTKETLAKKIKEIREIIQKAEKFEKNIQELKSNIKHTKEEINAIGKEIDAIDEKSLREEMVEVKQRRDIVKLNRDISDTLSAQMSKFVSASDQITQKKKELAGYKAQISRIELMSDDEFNKIKTDVASTQTLKGEISAEGKNLKDEVIPELEVKLRKVKEDVQYIESLRAKIKRYEKGYKIYSVLEGIFKKLPDRLLVNISESVSNVMTDRMQTMFPNRMISRTVLDPEGNISLHQGGQLVDPRQISGGEKAALGLALRIALMRHVAPLEFMILDEPTNHLDTQRINEFLSIIQDNAIFTSSTGQLLLVTHREEFEKVADRIINIKIEGSGNRSVDVQ